MGAQSNMPSSGSVSEMIWLKEIFIAALVPQLGWRGKVKLAFYQMQNSLEDTLVSWWMFFLGIKFNFLFRFPGTVWSTYCGIWSVSTCLTQFRGFRGLFLWHPHFSFSDGRWRYSCFLLTRTAVVLHSSFCLGVVMGKSYAGSELLSRRCGRASPVVSVLQNLQLRSGKLNYVT